MSEPEGEPGVAIIGAGLMSAGIAQVFLAGGVRVAVYDPASAALDALPGRISAGLDLLDIPNESPLGLLRPVRSLAAAVAGALCGIEAAPERLAVKRRISRNWRAPPSGAVLASNTSAIPDPEITQDSGTQRVTAPTLNPPYWPLVFEVVQAGASDPGRSRRDDGPADRIGMKPVHVAADVPGSVGNRLQHALKREAIALVANGICTARRWTR
jgi:3-hydroxybutyryl-CoA dehydrogenase